MSNFSFKDLNYPNENQQVLTTRLIRCKQTQTQWRNELAHLLLVFFIPLISMNASATVTISGGTSPTVLAGNPYSTLAAAVNALNAGGSLTAPVVLDVTAGHTEILASRITLTMTGTAVNSITIQKSGIGGNPVLFSYAGTTSFPSSTADGMFAIAGADYVTIDGIDLRESASNLSTITVMEFGYGLFKVSGSNGAQNNTIKNCTIILNRLQNSTWTGVGHYGSIGILMNNSTNISSIAVSTINTSGSNSFNKFYSNSISNCNAGIALIGFTAASPFTLADFNNDIGGIDGSTGNTIFNFGGALAAANQATGIFIQNQQNLNCSFNNIQNNNGAGVNHVTTLRGIYTFNTTMSASSDYTNNYIRVKGGGTTQEVSGMSITHSSSSITGTVNVSQNDISGDYLTVTTGVFQAIYLQVATVNLNVVSNNVHDMLISNQQPSGMGGFVYGIYTPTGAQNLLIYNNTISNITGTGISGYTTVGLFTTAATNQIVRKNQLSNISIGGTGTFSFMQGMSLATSATGTMICDSNTVTGIHNYKASGNGTLNGIAISGNTQSESTRYNTISNLSNAGSGITYGLNTQLNSSNRVIASNTISGITSAGTSVAGLSINLFNMQVIGNKIYNIVGTSSGSPLVSGILLSGGANSTITKIVNNLVGLVNAPNANTASAGNPTVYGIRLDAATTNSGIELSFNSIYLDASSSAANFGSAGVYQTVAYTALPTTSNLIMRNNLIYNNSTPSGIGLTTAFQRSTSNKSNYNSNSNKNLFYAGTPSPNRLIYTDTAVFDQTLAAYQATMSGIGADQQSYDGAIVFQSTVGSDTNFMKFDVAIPTLLESRASAIPGVTSDFANQLRHGSVGYSGTGSAPDIGAWELNGQVVGGCSGMPAMSNAVTSHNNPPCSSPVFTLSLDGVYGLGVTYQWEESSTGPSSGFNPIAGAIYHSLVNTSSALKWYRCVVTCQSTLQSITSNSVMVGPSPLSGTYLIDTSGIGEYTNFYSAINDLTCKGISGPVVFQVTAGQVFNETNNLVCDQTGTASNTITLERIGTGANPIIRRTGTNLGNDYIIKLEGVDHYTFNGINFEQAGTSGSTYVDYGIYITANPNDGARNNTFKNGIISTTNAVTGTRGVFMERTYFATSSEGTNSYNRFLNMTVQECFTGYYFSGVALDFKDLGNEINTEGGGNSLIQNLGSTSVNGSMIGVYTDAQFNFILQHTEVKNIVSPSGSLVNGISISGGDSVNISYNLVHDITTPTSLNGMTVSPLSNGVVAFNSIYNLSGTGTSSAVNIKGLQVAASNPGIPDTGMIRVFGNKVYNLNSTGISTSQTIGLVIGKGQPLVYNNMISKLSARHGGTPGGAYGLFVSNLETTTVCKIYHNTVYLDDSSANPLYASAGIISPSLSGKLDLRNNVIVNASNVTTGTHAVALMKNNSADILDTVCNNNLWYAGTPGPKNLLYFDGTNSAQTLAAFKALSIISPAESNSKHENVFFQLPVNGNLRPNNTIPTRIESGGQPIADVVTDFEADLRNSLTPDCGADEGNFTPGTPDCSGYPANSNTISSPVNPCPSGLFTLSTNVYFNFDYSFQWESSLTDSVNGFSAIPGATSETYTTSSALSRWYRCVVTCNASGLNTVSSALRVNLSPLSGTYTIDKLGNGDFLSFGEAITAIHCKGVAGPVVFEMTAGQVFIETGNLEFTYTGTQTNTITFRRVGVGNNPVVRRSGSSSISDYIIRLTGADYYTFDGIDFEQSGTSTFDYVEYGIYLTNATAINGSSSNVFKNGVITMSNLNANSKGVYLLSPITPTSASGTNSGNRFINMTIQQANEGYRIWSIGSFPGIGNEINVDTTGNPSAVSRIQLIGHNSVNAWATGANIDFQQNFIFANTEMQFFASSATVNAIDGLKFGTASLNSAIINNNRFHHFTAPGSILGISITGGSNYIVSYNRVHDITCTATGTAATGISVNATGSLNTITANRVYAIANSAVNNCSAIGIILLSGTNTLSNNMVSDLHAPGSTLSTGSIKGISIMGATSGSTTRLYYNTIYLNDVGAATNYTSAGIYNGSTVPTLDFRNNVVVNNSNVTVGQRCVAFWKSSTTDNIDNASNNNLWYAGVPGVKNLIYYNGTNVATTLAQYLIASSIAPADANAATENVVFQSLSDGLLRPSTSAPTVIEGSALLINGFNTDFENDSRHPTAPDRGADEGNYISNSTSIPSCATNLTPTNNSTSICSYQPVTLLWSAPVNSVPVNLGYDLYFGTGNNPPFLSNVNGVNYTLTNLLPNTVYYWKIVPKNSNGSATGCIVQSFTTTDAVITSVTPDTVCGTGMVSLDVFGTGNFTWYDSATAGNIVNFGNNYFNTISTTTTYYIETTLGSYITSTARPYPANFIYTTQPNSGLVFNASREFTLQSVEVYTQVTSAANFTVQLQNSSGFVLQSANVTVAAGSPTTPRVATLNFNVPQENGLRLVVSSSISLLFESGHSGFPYSLSGFGIITGGLAAGSTSASYINFYNWKISSACTSPRVPVTAQVNQAPPLLLTPSAPVNCQVLTPRTLTASSTYPYTYYYWSPASNLVGGTGIGSSVSAYNGSTTVYTVTATDGICTATKTLVHTVNTSPQLFTSSYSQVCLGDSFQLQAYANLDHYYLDTITVVPFIDISATGTSVGIVSNNSEHLVPTPHIQFGSSIVQYARISSNGLIAFNSFSGFANPLNSDFPVVGNSSGDVFLAPFWDDLDAQATTSIKTQQVGSKFIIQFTNQTHFNVPAGSITYQVQIDTINSNIVFVYQDVEFGDSLYDFGKSATVGLQVNSNSYTRYSFNQASLKNNQSISFISEENLISYTWAGPNGFTSSQQHPVIQSASNLNAGNYTVTATSVHGCTSVNIVTVGILPLTLNPPLSVSTCNSYYWSANNKTFTQSGVYYDTSNCQISQLNLTINNGVVSIDTVTGCDSYYWPLVGVTYTATGLYGAYSTLTCDTFYIQLTILPSSSGSTTISNCISYTWPVNGITYTQSGTYQHVAGCHTQTLNLTITPGTTNTTIVNACNSYNWPLNNITYTQSGMYQVISGCAIHQLNLTISLASYIDTQVVACNAYMWPISGITYTQSGIYIYALQCDSMRLNLTIHQETSSIETITALNSYVWPANAQTYTQSGSYSHTYINMNGCLHTATLSLTILNSGLISVTTIQDQSISCHGLNDGSCQAIGYPVGNYNYSLDGGIVVNQTGFFFGLTPGIHTVCASDGINTYCDTVMIQEPDSLQIIFNTDSLVSCQGNDGALSVQITGGTNYLQGYLTWWTNANGDTLNNVLNNNFATNLSGLASGMYHVIVEDDHGCFATASGIILAAMPLTVNAVHTPIVCHNGKTNIVVNTTGGVTYLPPSITINGLPVTNPFPSGFYTIVATDAKGCTASTTVTITQPLSISGSSIVTTCPEYSWNGITYTASGTYSGTFTASNGCDSIHQLTLNIQQGIRISPKVLLSGAYAGNGMMHDSLRVLNKIPSLEPYTAMNFFPVSSLGGEVVSPALLAVTGFDAIVDWVHIEIRSAQSSYSKVATMNALVQRDGDVVDANGLPLYFPAVCPDDYHIAIKHRNHLGVMTAAALSLNETTQVIDFTTASPVWMKPGLVNTPRKIDGLFNLLWSGDTRSNKNVKYNGSSNDKDPVLYAVGNATPNNILYPVYRPEDANMDGRIKYNNSDNDKNHILNQVLFSYPLSVSPNAVISQHTPD